MKNLKNMMAATGLAAVLMMSATSAQAGLLMSDRAVAINPSTECTDNADTSLYSQFAGILIVGVNGLLMSDAPVTDDTGCKADTGTDGLLMSD